jgi:hypothetical protein
MHQAMTAVRVVGTRVGTLPTREGNPVLSHLECTKLGRMAAPIIIFLKDLVSSIFLDLHPFWGGGHV